MNWAPQWASPSSRSCGYSRSQPQVELYPMPLSTPDATALGLWGVPMAVIAGAIRNSTPFIFVSLGETLTEKSGRINLGQEGTLVMGAMAGFGVSYLTN